MRRVKVGCIGAGSISNQYLGIAQKFPVVEMVAVADLDEAKARAQAGKYNVPRVMRVEDLIADPEIEIVLNLTIPAAHVPLAVQCLKAGKHTYLEKPLGIDRDNARQLVDLARETGLRVGCAPDTFLGSGIQTARKAIDDGLIGRPLGFTATMAGRGHETWHPSPEFYYKPGGGPMLDMGPYYLTALLNLLGPINRVAGLASIAIPQRTITSQPLHGKTIDVEVPDHIVGVMEFASGAAGTIITSFACHASPHDHDTPITIFGEAGTLKVGDPNGFDKPVLFCKLGQKEYEELPKATPEGFGRSVGLADMAVAIQEGRPHRCSLEQAFCALDAMQGFTDTSRTGTYHTIQLPYERPDPMRPDASDLGTSLK